MQKTCGLAKIAGRGIECTEEGCAFWVSSTKMCVIKDIAHTLKQQKENGHE